MPKGSLLPILFTTVLAFCSLYAPQPILPVLAEHLSVDQSQVSLLVTLALLPLSLAPVFYGFVLEASSARALLRGTVLLLALSLVPFLFSDAFLVLCAARLLQGLLLPAVFTALMTYCASAVGPEDLARTMGAYIAATISGGFLGRAVTGLVADWVDWRFAFLLWVVGLVIAWVMLGRLPADPRTSVQPVKLRMVSEVMRQGELRRAYIIAFLAFFVFASVLNVLPFEMKRLDPGVSEATVALAYSGYLIGILIALHSGRMIAFLRSEARVVRIGLLIYGVGLAFFSIRSIPVMYAVMVVFCAGMFMIHSVLSTYVNHLARTHKGVVNGLYVSFYYGGGTLGSYLPVLVYRAYGWTAYLLVLAGLVGVVAILSMGMRGAPATSVRLS